MIEIFPKLNYTRFCYFNRMRKLNTFTNVQQYFVKWLSSYRTHIREEFSWPYSPLLCRHHDEPAFLLPLHVPLHKPSVLNLKFKQFKKKSFHYTSNRLRLTRGCCLHYHEDLHQSFRPSPVEAVQFCHGLVTQLDGEGSHSGYHKYLDLPHSPIVARQSGFNYFVTLPIFNNCILNYKPQDNFSKRNTVSLNVPQYSEHLYQHLYN